MTTGQKVSDDAEYTFTVEMNTSLIAHFTKNGETPDPQPKEWTVTIDGTGHKVKDGETLTVEEPSKPGHAFCRVLPCWNRYGCRFHKTDHI